MRHKIESPVYQVTGLLFLAIAASSIIHTAQAAQQNFRVLIQIVNITTVSQTEDMSIPGIKSESQTQVLILQPDDSRAAKMTIDSDENHFVNYSIIEPSIELESENGPVVIDQFEFETRKIKQSSKEKTDIRIGATITVPPFNGSRNYIANATFSLLYQ